MGVAAITALKDGSRSGPSSIAIKKHMQVNMASDKKWLNATFLKALKSMVAGGDLVQTKSSYKLSPEFKKKAGKSTTKKAAPKKKVAAAKKKAAPKKKTAPKKKAATKKKAAPKKKTAAKKKTATKKKSAPKKKTTKKKTAAKKK